MVWTFQGSFCASNGTDENIQDASQFETSEESDYFCNEKIKKEVKMWKSMWVRWDFS